jgi:hypothetical protein
MKLKKYLTIVFYHGTLTFRMGFLHTWYPKTLAKLLCGFSRVLQLCNQVVGHEDMTNMMVGTYIHTYIPYASKL